MTNQRASVSGSRRLASGHGRTSIISLVTLLVLGLTSQASAMKSPSAILWGYPPEIFVQSLYHAVLGRRPESREVVVAWARHAQTPHGRYQVFWQFIRSPEYRSKYGHGSGRGGGGGAGTGSGGSGLGAGGYGDWSIYYKRNRWDTDYTVAQRMPTGYHGVVWGPYPLGIAIALRAFMAEFYDNYYTQ